MFLFVLFCKGLQVCACQSLVIPVVDDAVPRIKANDGLEGLIATGSNVRFVSWHEGGIVEAAIVHEIGHGLLGRVEIIAELFDLKVGLGSFWSSASIEVEGWSL
jgi:hypothetical protein